MSRKKEVTIGITINLENYENLRLEVQGDAETHEDVDDLVSFLDGMLARFGRGDPATAERVDAYRRRVLALRPTKPEAPAPAPEPRVETVAPIAPVPAGPGSVQQKVEGTSPPPHAIEVVAPPAPKQSKPEPKPVAESTKQPEPTPEPKLVAESTKRPEPIPEPKPVTESTKQPEPTPEPKPVVESTKQPEPTPEPKPVVESTKQPEPTPEPKPIVGTPEQPDPGPAGAKPPAAGEGEICETCGEEVTKSQAKLSNLFMNKTLCKKCMEQP